MTAEQRTERRTNALWWATCILGSLLMAGHFSLIQLSNMPTSPLKLRIVNPLARYVSPYFAQNWSFFAPTPIDRDYALLARVSYKDPQSGHVITTNWLDVSDTLIGAVRQHRLTPLFHVEIALSNALMSFINKLPDDPRAMLTKDGKRYFKPELPSDVDPVDMTVMRRTALATLEIVYPQVAFDKIQLGVSTVVFPRFTQRNVKGAKTEVAFSSIDWQHAEWVTPYLPPRN